MSDARSDAIDSALSVIEEPDLTHETTALVTANGAVAAFSEVVEALKDTSFLRLDTPDKRRLAAMLHERISPVESVLRSHRIMIESSFRRYLIEEGAIKATLGDGTPPVTLLVPDARYETDEQALFEGLKALVGTSLTEKQLADAIHIEVHYKVNHAKLNALHKNMGTKVQEVIDRNRRRIPGDPANGKVVMPKVGGQNL